MREKIQLDIQPPTGIYSTYQRLTYTIWHAIAEFVDNSTASYEFHKSTLKLHSQSFYKLKVYIIYKSNKKTEDCVLTIHDNAFGMEIDEFKRAIILNSPPLNKTGRNEFGMGLKTAASWFGNEWKITSTQLGSNNQYSTVMDINKLAITNEKNIEIEVTNVDPSVHYTELTIKKLNKKITVGKRKKVINQIASIYRKDLRNNEIEIKYVEWKEDKDGNVEYTNDGDKFYSTIDQVPNLNYEFPEIWTYENEESGAKESYYKDFSEEVIFDDRKYWINGFVAIREKGSRSDAGLTLIRRNRVIIGGPDENNYRPKDIFGDSGTFAYQRIFGEVNMDNWPVTQAKNAFDWDNGLEEAFIHKMKSITKEYVSKSKELRVKENIKISQTTDQEIIKNNLSIEGMFKKSIGGLVIEKFNDPINKTEINSLEEFKNTSKSESEKLSNYLVFKTKDGSNNEIHIDYVGNFKQTPSDWLKIDVVSNEGKIHKFKVTIFYEHQFFKPYVNDGEFILIIKQFAIALAVSIINARYLSIFKGQNSLLEILEFMNEYLKQVAKEIK